MKKSNLPIFITCPLHPTEFIQRVSTDSSSTKDLFCIECIIEHEISNTASLQTLEEFLASTFAFYSTQEQGSNGITAAFEPPLDTLNVLKNKAETIAQLEKHIAQEKVRVKELFNTISDNIIGVISKKRDHYIDLLDQQLTNLQQNYAFFEEQLKRGFPRHGDSLSTLSSEEVIKTSFAQMDDFAQLSHFVKRIKKDFAKNERGINVHQLEQDKRKTYFRRLLNMLENISSNNPVFDCSGLDVKVFTEDIKQHIDGSLDKLLNIKQSILAGGLSCDELESQILKPEHFEVIRSWVPKKYSFALKLLYRASQHGFTPEAFHSRCDKRGATITIIECQFLRSKKRSIIGAFLDQDWHNKEGYIASEEAFLFSVDTGIKCLLSGGECAAYGGSYLPIFGEGFDVCICTDLKQSFVCPKSYRNAQSLVDPEVYIGPDHLYYFIPYNIEVYALR